MLSETCGQRFLVDALAICCTVSGDQIILGVLGWALLAPEL